MTQEKKKTDPPIANGAVTVRFSRSVCSRGILWARRVVLSVWWRLRLGDFGRRSTIGRPFLLTSPKNLYLGSDVTIWRGARIETFATASGHGCIDIGDGTVIQPHVHLASASMISIGPGTLFASYVYVTDHDHAISDPHAPKTRTRALTTAAVQIGANVWLGEKVIVLKGVEIGDNSIVGAGSVVTHDIPRDSLAIGSPARVIRQYDAKNRRWNPVEGAQDNRA